METMTILITAGACAITGIIIWLALRSYFLKQSAVLTEKLEQQTQVSLQSKTENERLHKEKEALIADVTRNESRLQFLEDQYISYQRYQKEYQLIQSQLAMFKAKFQAAEEKLLHQKAELEQIGERFKFEFKNLAQSILEEKTQKFTQVNEEKMNAILTPLKNQLGEFKQKVEDTYDKESKERFSLGKEVQRLIEMSAIVSQEANNLTTALKGNNKIQGNWGEMILDSILQNSGLTKGREYFLQEFIKDKAGNIIKDESGKALQPDATIFYPDQRKVIIDSKVSLIAWEQYIAANNPEDQKKFLQDHTRSIRTHIDGLSRKNYPKYALALDYVLLFIPVEPAFLEALKTDLFLWKYAYDKKILLVSPTNLFAVLKIVADLWKVEQQNLNAMDIANKAGALYDKFVGFTENLEIAGKKIGEANIAYENAYRQLCSGKGNIAGRIEELRKMGAKAGKQLPDRMIAE